VSEPPNNRTDVVGRVPPRGAGLSNTPNAASGDAAYNMTRPAAVGRVPSHGAAPTGRKMTAQGNNVAAASRRSSKEAAPSRDGSATLGNPPPNTSKADAGSGDPAYNATRPAPVGRVPSRGVRAMNSALHVPRFGWPVSASPSSKKHLRVVWLKANFKH
jgi:hypothetical protein